MPGELSPDIKSFFWTPPHPMSEDCLQIVTSGWVPRPECPSPWGTKPLLEAPSPYPNRCKLKCEFLNWRTVDLQCSVSFCCTTKWCSYIYISLNSFSYSLASFLPKKSEGWSPSQLVSFSGVCNLLLPLVLIYSIAGFLVLGSLRALFCSQWDLTS